MTEQEVKELAEEIIANYSNNERIGGSSRIDFQDYTEHLPYLNEKIKEAGLDLILKSGRDYPLGLSITRVS